MPNPSAPSQPGKSKVSPLRIALFAILGIMVIALVIDQIARSRAKAAHAKVAALLHEEDTVQQDAVRSLPPRTPSMIHTLLSREPAEPGSAAGSEFRETYRWQGALRSYFIVVIYSGGGGSSAGEKPAEPLLERVLLNSEEEE